MRLVFFICMSVLLQQTKAQQVGFTAQSDAKQVVVGGTFTITFTLQNADGDAFQPPDFTGVRVISGPSQSYRSTFINGRSSTSVGFSYTLQAIKMGSIKIGPASIRTDAKTLRTDPITIQVVKARSPVTGTNEGQEPDIFIRAEVDTARAYIGQQVVIRYKIYTQINIENYNILAESSYDGCYSQVLDAYREPVVKEVIGGVEYSTKVLRKVAVFPQQSGKIEFEPLVVRIGIPDRTKRRSFFSSFSLKTRNLSSDKVSLRIRSAYDGAPQSFSGAVGHFQSVFQLSNTKITTDDALTLRLQLVGNGDIKTIRPPKLKLPPGFDQYDPKTIDEKMINGNDSIRGVKTIEYMITSADAGQYQLMPEFTYFDPRTDSYIMHRDTFSVRIEEGINPIRSNGDNRLSQSEVQLSPIIYSTTVRKSRSFWIAQPWYWVGASVPLLGFLVIFLGSKYEMSADPAEADHSSIAHLRLAKAKSFMEGEKASAFYEEVALSVKQFITSKLDIPPADLSKDSIVSALALKDVAQQVVDSVSDLLQQCDFAIYAGVKQTEKMASTYEQAVQIIDQLEQDL